MSDQQAKPPVLARVPADWSRMTPAEKDGAGAGREGGEGEDVVI